MAPNAHGVPRAENIQKPGPMRREFPIEPKHAKRAAALLAIILALCSAFMAYRAMSSELSGNAIYGNRPGRRVTRESEPEKFREAVSGNWSFSGILIVLAGISYALHRKIDDYA
jgi:hypothetical protein